MDETPTELNRSFIMSISKSGENTPICFHVPRSLKTELDDYKARTGVPLAYAMRTALAEYLVSRNKQQLEQEVA
jgi:hypothetical protein